MKIRQLKRGLPRLQLLAIAAVLSISAMMNVPISTVFAAGEGFSTVANKTAQKSQTKTITDLQVTGTGNDEVNVSLFVPNGTLTLGSTTNVTAAGNGTNSIQMSGYRNDINSSLSTLSFLSANSGSFKVDVTLGGGDGAVYNPANGHVYRITPADPDDNLATITWNDAKVAAETTTYGNNHVPGYLATVTSQQEHDFVMQRVSGDGWIGASDSTVEGEWRWVTGPEGAENSGAGRLFWTGNGSGSATPGNFANWASNEPNNSGGGDGEDCAQLRTSASGKWNDLPCNASNIPYYIVEYGSPSLMPEVTTAQFTITIAGTEDASSKELDIISTSTNGDLGNRPSSVSNSAVSNDGRYVVFTSTSSNLVAGDTNNKSDVFMKDRDTGVTVRVSTDSSGAQSNGDTNAVSISGDGRYAIFESSASNLVAGDINGKSDIFRKDLQTGTTELVSVGMLGEHGNDNSGYMGGQPVLSGDGNLAMFLSSASNLLSGDSNNKHNAFLKNMTTGEVKIVDRKSSGLLSAGGTPTNPKLSYDGKFAFFTQADAMIPEDPNGNADLYRKNLSNDNYKIITKKYDGTVVPVAVLSAMHPSSNGRYVAFDTKHPLLASQDTQKLRSYVRDIDTDTVTLASTSATGEEANADAQSAGMSGDGRYVLLWSKSTNLGLDFNDKADLFIKDTQTGNVSTASLTDKNTGSKTDIAFGASLSGDGQTVVMGSAMSGFKTGVATGYQQIYARTIATDNAPLISDPVPNDPNQPSLPSPAEENEAPNDGDGNVDTVPDMNQDNVASFASPVTGKYTTIELADGCQFTDAFAIKESTDKRDIGYNYDNGLTRFSATCPDSNTQVKIFHHGTRAAELTLRKYNSNNGTYFTVPGATITEQTIDGQIVAIATYTITDNGPLDLNPDAGVISDPAGLARQVVGVPNTGLGGRR